MKGSYSVILTFKIIVLLLYMILMSLGTFKTANLFPLLRYSWCFDFCFGVLTLRPQSSRQKIFRYVSQLWLKSNCMKSFVPFQSRQICWIFFKVSLCKNSMLCLQLLKKYRLFSVLYISERRLVVHQCVMLHLCHHFKAG